MASQQYPSRQSLPQDLYCAIKEDMVSDDCRSKDTRVGFFGYLEEGVIESREVGVHNGVIHQLSRVRSQRRLEVRQRALLVRLCNGNHCIHIQACPGHRGICKGLQSDPYVCQGVPCTGDSRGIVR